MCFSGYKDRNELWATNSPGANMGRYYTVMSNMYLVLTLLSGWCKMLLECDTGLWWDWVSLATGVRDGSLATDPIPVITQPTWTPGHEPGEGKYCSSATRGPVCWAATGTWPGCAGAGVAGLRLPARDIGPRVAVEQHFPGDVRRDIGDPGAGGGDHGLARAGARFPCYEEISVHNGQWGELK